MNFQPTTAPRRIHRASRARHHRVDVHLDETLAAKHLRHIAVRNPLREPFDDRSLAHPGLAAERDCSGGVRAGLRRVCARASRNLGVMAIGTFAVSLATKSKMNPRFEGRA